MKHTKPLDAILRSVVKRRGLLDGLDGARAVTSWEQVVGPQLSRVSIAESLKEGILHVKVRSGAWAQELSLAQGRLLERCRELLGQDVVRGFRFTVGTLAKRGETLAAEVPEQTNGLAGTEPHEGSELAVDEQARLESWRAAREGEVEQVKDPKLREHVRAWLQVVRRRQEELLRRGGTRCPRCGAVVQALDRVCVNCRLELGSRLRDRIKELLSEAPWLGVEDVTKLVPGADKTAVSEARLALADELNDEVRESVARFLGGLDVSEKAKTRLRLRLATLVMLGQRVPPGRVTRDAVFRSLGPQAAAAWGRLSGLENTPR